MRHLALRRPVIVGAGAVVTGALLLNSAGDEGTWIFPNALLGAMDQETAPHILDVRTTREYAAGHVPGAIHIPYHQLWQRHAELAAGKADLIVVYCSHGPRAGMAKLQLWALGYRKLAYLKGQMSGWKREGLPMRIGRQSRRDGAAAQTQGAKSPLVRRAAKVRRSESAEGWKQTVRAEDRARTWLLHAQGRTPAP
jgi:rhodanese-related sulfurtransferase